MELKPLNLPGQKERPFVLAGPCSVETEEQVMTTARSLADKGIKIFRGGVWKPRTKPGGFEGHGEKALVWMKQVKEETGMELNIKEAEPFACSIGYYKDWPSVGKNRKIEIYYYEIKTDEKPNLDNKDLIRAMSEEWNKLTDEEKKPYVKKADADKKRYLEEMKAYEKKKKDS